jgi:alpha-glucosidase
MNNIKSVGLLNVLFFLMIVMIIMSGCNSKDELKNIVKSPDGKIQVEVHLSSDSTIYYNVTFNDTLLMKESKLGIHMKNSDFANNMILKEVTGPELVKEEYTMQNGKRKSCSYQANRKIFHFENTDRKKMDIIFQVSDDGVAFHYYFPEASDDVKEITDELTSFHFLNGVKAWLQPKAIAKSGWGKCNPSYEEHYYQDIPPDTSAPFEAGWVYPALFKYHDTWVLISETNMDGTYCGTGLKQHSPDNEYAVKFPQKEEFFPGGGINPKSKLPWYSPWRTITIGSLATIIESTMGTDLAGPAKKMDKNFIKPGRASWSWVLLKDDYTVFPVQKEFIDYASDMGWEYCLVDSRWDTQIGYDKIQELIDYGKKKNVGILLWYNSAGNWNETPLTPRNLMLTKESRMKEFGRIKKMGVKGVKVDFFGGDGQSFIKYYIDILNDAAKNGLLVNFHGCTLPRGWHRTYPNLMSMEAIKGFEFVTFDQPDADLQPNHCTVIPFTRNVFDPMDFTPVCFSEIYNVKRKTSNAFELALAVLFQSGIQHYAEIPEGMETVPSYVKEVMRNIPSVWNDVKFIDGFPGKYVVIARKKGSTWYVAGINGENKAREVKIDLSFTGKPEAFLITGGNDNRSFQKKNIADTSKEINIKMNSHGGFLIVTEE